MNSTQLFLTKSVDMPASLVMYRNRLQTSAYPFFFSWEEFCISKIANFK